MSTRYRDETYIVIQPMLVKETSLIIYNFITYKEALSSFDVLHWQKTMYFEYSYSWIIKLGH
jgi:hypothetical protein